MDDEVKRIAHMEATTDDMVMAIDTLKQALQEWSRVRNEFQAVQRYYYSEAWHSDRQLSDEDKLPEGMPHGVLSEDTVFDVMRDNHFLALSLIETAMKEELKRDDEC